MRRRQQFAEWLSPHHIGAGRRIELIGRIGLAALELQDGQRAGISLDIRGHPLGEIGLVDPVPLLDRPRAGKFLVPPDVVRHDDAPSPFVRHSGLDVVASPRIDGAGALSVAPVNDWSERLHTSEVQVWQWRGYAPRPDRPPGASSAWRRSPWRAPHPR